MACERPLAPSLPTRPPRLAASPGKQASFAGRPFVGFPPFHLLLILTLSTLVNLAGGDFTYPDFESTEALTFNGAAATSSCDMGERASYQPRHGSNDASVERLLDGQEEGTTLIKTAKVRTATASAKEKEKDRTQLAGIGHRDDYEPHPTLGCKVRLRLTPSEPRKEASVWHDRPVSVLRGFTSEFAFQITDPSRTCQEVKDRTFSTAHHTSCVVHGGDGFAFVIHDHDNRTKTIGRGGEDVGYGGIGRSLAVEFDTWYNPDIGDLFEDHVSIQAAGERPERNALTWKPGTTNKPTDNSPGATARINIAKPTPLADGKVHVARVAYWPFVNYALAPYFTATSELTKFILDNDEGRRVGTLAVYVDDLTKPLLAMPINLSVVMKLKEGLAYAGFTSSTGNAWQKHDILSWNLCEDPEVCGFKLSNDLFDYHEQSKKYQYKYDMPFGSAGGGR